ncbi:MAG: flagellar basal body rod protein FlgB [Treponemataceae bacterium]
MNNFSKTVDMLHRAMNVNSLRYQVSAYNLANAEVPNFKRTSVNFESELKKALDSEAKSKDSFKMTVSNPLHLKSEGARDYRTVEPRRVLDYTTTVKANGNNVDAEQEAMEILKIQLSYQLLTQMQSFQFSQMKTVLK